MPHLVDDGLSILEYADDTILFMDHELEKAKNLKLVLCAFEELSGLNINFHKSELFCVGEAHTVEDECATTFGYESAQFPIHYLGIPIHYRWLTIAECRQIEEMIQKTFTS